MRWVFLLWSQASAKRGYSRVSVLLTLLAALLLGAGLMRPATAAVEVLAAPDLGLMVAGSVQAIARQSDGKLIIGGYFSLVDGVPRLNIARLNADGSLDSTWNPGANSTVTALAVDSNDNIYVGGQFTTLGGQGRNRIARVTSAGAVDSWYPAGGANGDVATLAVDGNDNIYVGGPFSTLGGQGRNYIARVTSAGAVDSWYPSGGANSTVYALAVDGNDNVYVGGSFSTLGGQGRNYIARVTSAGAVDSWYPTNGANGTVATLAVDSNDNIYVGGGFTTLGGSTHLSLAVVDKTSGTPMANSVYVGHAGNIWALARDSAGRLVVGGSFYGVRGGIGRNNLLRLNADGSLDTTWNPSASGPVNALAVDGSNNVYVGGQFGTLGGQPRNRIARVTSAGAVDGWYPGGVGASGTVYALALDGSNNVYVGGFFTTLGGQGRNNIARVTNAGAVDGWYPPGGANDSVNALAVDGSNLYVGGFFTTLGGLPRNYIARVNGGGAVDGWYPPGGANGAVGALALDGSNHVYVGGSFSTLGGQSRNRIAHVTGAGVVDTWYPSSANGQGANGAVFALTVDDNHNVYVGGGFLTLGGQSRDFIARVTSAGAVDGWYPLGGANDFVNALAVDGNNHVYVGGRFTTLGGQGRAALAALAASRLTVVAVNGGTAPAVNTPFAVDLQLQDSTHNPVTVATATPMQLSVKIGAGVLGGTTACTIDVGASGCTVSGLTYSQVETGVILRATATGGDVADPGDSAPFDVVKATPTLSLDRTPNSDTFFGQDVTFTATVTATLPTTGIPTGTVTFNDGATLLCANVALSNNSAACTTSALSPGNHSITAIYSGDANFNGSTSTSQNHTVNKADTTTAITSDTPDPSAVGQSVTVNYTVTTASGTPTGTVTISDGAVSCTGTVAAGACALTFTSAGAKTLTATYSGDTNFNGSTSTSQNHTVNKADTTTAITSDTPDPSAVGQPVTVNYTVAVTAPGTGTPTGTVTISDGAVSCSGTLPATSCNLTLTSRSEKRLAGKESRSRKLKDNKKTSQSHTVNKADTTTAITSDTPDPSAVGQSVTVNYTVTTASGTPTGTVTISDGTVSCSGTLPATSCNLTLTSAGAKTLTATYSGDANFNGSTSDTEGHEALATTAQGNVSGGNVIAAITGGTCIGFATGSTGFPTPPTPLPSGVTFPYDMFGFTAICPNSGGTLTLTMTYPNPLPTGTQYWKYGPTSDNHTPHWYVLDAILTGNTATFTITDGGLGDDDLTANGNIEDQGGPGVTNGATNGATGIPTLSEWSLLLLSILLGILGFRRWHYGV